MMVFAGLTVVFRYVFWILVIAGVGAFIWRRLKGIPIRNTGRNATEGDPITSPPEPPPFPFAPDPTLTSPTTPPTSPTSTGSPLSPPTGSNPPDQPPATPPSTAPAAESAPSSPAPTGAVPSEAAADLSPSARSGFFARSEQSTTDPGRPESGSRATVAEAVRGISMPCGLAPVVDGSVSIPNPFRVAFLTTGVTATEVGAAVADELERLGFKVSTATPTELLARRDGVEVRAVLYPTPSSAKRGFDPIFPVAPSGAIGLELAT
jgi:hypothetical protein